MIAAVDLVLFMNYFEEVEEPEPALPSNDFKRLVQNIAPAAKKPTPSMRPPKVNGIRARLRCGF
jgi:hypothetical protein